MRVLGSMMNERGAKAERSCKIPDINARNSVVGNHVPDSGDRDRVDERAPGKAMEYLGWKY